MGVCSDGTLHEASKQIQRFAVSSDAAPGTAARMANDRFAAGLRTLDREAECGMVGAVSLACIGSPQLRSTKAPCRASSAQLAARFAEVGFSLLDELAGAFALAIYDAERERGFVCTDRMGIVPLFVLQLERGVAFSDAPGPLSALTDSPHAISTQAVFNYLYGHVIPAPNSIYEGPRRLLPGEAIELNAGKVSLRRYWTPTFDEKRDARFETLRDEFLAALRASVRDAMHEATCGAFLSGGTDSSTIAGLMTELGGAPAPTFSIGFSAAGYDEMEYARLASAHFGTRHHELYVTPADIVEALPKLAAAHPQPFGNSSALPAYLCARLAKEHGVERMLGGDGGDELFGGNARYAKQYVFSLYERVPPALRTALIEPFCRFASQRPGAYGFGKMVSYVEQASVPMPARLETYNFLNRLGSNTILSDDFVARLNTSEPASLNEAEYFNPSARSLINRMLALDFKTTLADNDLPKVVHSCKLAGLPVAFPFLDPRVVDFSLALPPNMKLKGTRLRYFFKKALRGFLPEAIIRKPKHGFGLPFGEWAVSDPALRELTYDTLNDLKARRWVRADFIDRLKDQFLPEFPNYYGTMAWVLITLELWLKTNHDHK
jgi:asparagine synthase (glutamine-hydrolysing)